MFLTKDAHKAVPKNSVFRITFQREIYTIICEYLYHFELI